MEDARHQQADRDVETEGSSYRVYPYNEAVIEDDLVFYASKTNLWFGC
jgi:hypothetical protein